MLRGPAIFLFVLLSVWLAGSVLISGRIHERPLDAGAGLGRESIDTPESLDFLERGVTAVQGHAQKQELVTEPPAGTADQSVAPKRKALGQPKWLIEFSRRQY